MFLNMFLFKKKTILGIVTHVSAQNFQLEPFDCANLFALRKSVKRDQDGHKTTQIRLYRE